MNDQGVVNFDLLDSEVSSRFFREVPNRSVLSPVIPLLLWSNCYYLGSPVAPSSEDIKKLSDHSFTDIKIIPIADKSYRTWFHTQNFNANSISAATLIPQVKKQSSNRTSKTAESCLNAHRRTPLVALLLLPSLFFNFCPATELCDRPRLLTQMTQVLNAN